MGTGDLRGHVQTQIDFGQRASAGVHVGGGVQHVEPARVDTVQIADLDA